MLDPLPGPPRHVGPYRLLALIGSGGMGEVYLARERRPGAPLVAVKTVRPDLDIDREFRIRFRREIAAARAVSGPGTAALLAGDADTEVPWLATEYVAGPSLADTVGRCGPLPVDAVRAVGAGLARALASVHAAQVLHRDLKPGNVLLTPDGPTLIDFGIAQAFDATALTTAGMVVGTPGFMAPEQLEGSHAVVPASDVFTLGAVLCFAATGRGPFDDQELASVIFRIAQGDADLSAVPEGLRAVIAECLSPAPDDRPTAAALAERLTDGTGPSAVPWPAPVLSLFAEHREAVTRCERAAGQGALSGAASLTDAATVSGTEPPRTPSAPATPRRRTWWIVAAAAVAAVVTVAAVLIPEDGDGDGDNRADRSTGDPGHNSRGPSGSGSKTPAPRVVPEYGNPGHSGEFGDAKSTASVRPEGWKPWSVRRPKGLDDKGNGCVLVGSKLVCRDGKGAATALDAATGAHRWTSRGFPVASDDLQLIQELPPVSDGERVYVPSERGTIAVDLASGTERWREPTASDTSVMALSYADGVVYTAEFGFADETVGPSRAHVRARRAKDGHELWKSPPLPAKVQHALLVQDGKVYAAVEGKGVLTLSTTDGRITRRAPKQSCYGLLAHRGSVLCWDHGTPGVRELDPASLATRRTLAPGLEPTLPPVVGDADVLVVATGNPDPDAPVTHTMSAFDWRTGDHLWQYGGPQDTVSLALAGERVLAVGLFELWGRSTEEDVDSYRRKDIPLAKGRTEYDDPPSLRSPLYAGGALFTATDDGRILSGYAP